MAISDQNRAIYEGAGLNAVKLELAMGSTRFNLGLRENAAQAAEWVKERERARQRTRVIQAIVSVVGTVAAVIAAVASILALRK